MYPIVNEMHYLTSNRTSRATELYTRSIELPSEPKAATFSSPVGPTCRRPSQLRLLTVDLSSWYEGTRKVMGPSPESFSLQPVACNSATIVYDLRGSRRG